MTEQEFNQTAAELSTRFNKTADEKMGEIRAALRQQPTTQKAKPVHTQSVFRRKPFLATIAASLTLILALGIILPIALRNGSDVPEDWRQNAYQTVQNAQFTPNFERIVYNYETETNTAQAGATADVQKAEKKADSIAQMGTFLIEEKPLTQTINTASLMEMEEEDLVRVEIEQFERRSAYWQNEYQSSVGGKTLNKNDIGRQTGANKEIALYCVQNINERDIWQKFPDAPNIAATPYFEQFELYVMFTQNADGVIDIRLSATGFITSSSQYFYLDYRAGKTANIKKRFIVDPVNDNVEMLMEQSEPLEYPFDGGTYTVYDYPYISVKKDADFTVVGDSGISLFYEKETSGFSIPYEQIAIEEYRRVGDEYNGVVANFKYPSTPFFLYHYGKYHPDFHHPEYNPEYEKESEIVGDGGITVYTAKGSEQYVFFGREDFFSVFHATSEWEYFIENGVGFDGGGAPVYYVNGRIGVRAITGIQAFYFRPFSSGVLPNFSEKVELADETILDIEGSAFERPENIMENLNFFSFDSGRFFDDTWRIWGNLRLTRTYSENDDWSFSKVFNSVPFPSGVRYADGVDFTRADKTEQIIKAAIVLGVENAYLHPKQVVEKLNALSTDKLSFNAE